MPGHKLADAASTIQQGIPEKAAKGSIHAWPLDLEFSRSLEGSPKQARHVHIRVILVLAWLSAMGMWLSFPVLDLGEPTSCLGFEILHYQKLVNLDHPLTPFLLSSMASALANVALAGHTAEVDSSLAIALVVDILAAFAGHHFGLTPLQVLLLIMPLTTLSVITVIIILEKVTLLSHQKIISIRQG